MRATVCIWSKYAMINFNAISRRSTPIMKRREAREKALQALFQLENTEVTVDEAVTHIIESDKRNEFFERLVYETTEHQEEIDAKITASLENWSFERLPKVEKTVLRLAVFELLYMEETPKNVVVNEAIELCKTFSDEKAAKFVNGVLSNMVQV